jgi:hypothetical protein
MERELPTVNIVENTKEEVLNYYLNNSKVINKKKDEKGEVFTPIHIVEEMLDKMPNEFWKEKSVFTITEIEVWGVTFLE